MLGALASFLTPSEMPAAMDLPRSCVLFLVLGASALAEPLPSDPAYVTDSPCLDQLAESAAAWDCVGAILDEADAELNRVYQKHIDGVDPNWPLAKNYIETFRAAQRAWIAFRDADCQRVGVAARGDANIQIQTCYVYHTHKRIEELQAY